MELPRQIDFRTHILTESLSVKDVLGFIEEGSGVPCFLTDERGSLSAIFTDGDLRRLLLDGALPSSQVREHRKPFTALKVGAAQELVRQEMLEKNLSYLPEIDSHGVMKSLWFLGQRSYFEPNNTAVLILAGGRGKRMMPLTANKPKPLIEVNGIPLLDRNIEKCLRHGLSNFFISVNHMKEQIISHLREKDAPSCRISFLEEQSPLGTAGPISLLPKSSLENLLVLNADVLHEIDIARMIEFHNHSQAAITVSVRNFEFTIPYGVAQIEEISITGIEEKPTVAFPVNTGIYVLSREAAELVPNDKFFDMPDLIELALSEKMSVKAFFSHEYWLDVGTPENLEAAEDHFRAKSR